MSKQKVMFKAPFSDFSGYATVARQFLLELYKMDRFDLYLEPIVWINSGNLNLPVAEKAIINSLLEKSAKLQLEDVRDMTLIHFSIATEYMSKQQSPFKRNIGFTMLETDRTAPGWAFKCNQMDAIFVPSTFCLSSFMQSNITVPIRIVPFGIDFDIYKPDGEKLLPNLPTKYNFLTVGQWLQQGDRKNITGVLRTFLNVFKGNKDVGLILKTYHESAGTRDKLAVVNSIYQLRQEFGLTPEDPPHIYLVHGAMSAESMGKLYRQADAFILPTTGEAWGMPLMEAAATGLPIITTGGTGAESFLNPEFTIFLDAEWRELGNTMYWPNVYEPQQKLLIPNMEEFARMMHRVYKNNELSKEQGMKQREELVQREFTWKKAAEIMAQILDDLAE